LTSIDPVLLNYPILSLLLHKNYISDFNEVGKLSQMQRLTNLTLHNNPLEELAGYRVRVISSVPGLRKLDTVLLSKKERDIGLNWMDLCGKKGLPNQANVILPKDFNENNED